jgi:hypothetical protein
MTTKKKGTDLLMEFDFTTATPKEWAELKNRMETDSGLSRFGKMKLKMEPIGQFVKKVTAFLAKQAPNFDNSADCGCGGEDATAPPKVYFVNGVEVALTASTLLKGKHISFLVGVDVPVGENEYRETPYTFAYIHPVIPNRAQSILNTSMCVGPLLNSEGGKVLSNSERVAGFTCLDTVGSEVNLDTNYLKEKFAAQFSASSLAGALDITDKTKLYIARSALLCDLDVTEEDDSVTTYEDVMIEIETLHSTRPTAETIIAVRSAMSDVVQITLGGVELAMEVTVTGANYQIRPGIVSNFTHSGGVYLPGPYMLEVHDGDLTGEFLKLDAAID